MRGMKVALTVLTAGILALGSGAAFAAEYSTPTPAKPATPAVSQTKGMGSKAEAREPEAHQQRELRAEKSEAQDGGAGNKEAAADRTYDGVVAHVDAMAHPKTLVMNTMLGKRVLTVGVDVLPSTQITERGVTKTLADIHKGDRIWMKWDRTTNHLVADQIRILQTGKKRAAKAEKTSASAKAAPAA